MVATHYRWDFIGLSTDTKPTPETSEKVVDGSTFYCSDNSKLYVWCKNQWYEKEVSGGGGTTYTAGTGIDITNSTISVDTSTIQPKLTAGTGIDITDNTISATGGGATGEAKELTSADYDYPTDTPTGVALWLLPAGIYWIKQGVKVYYNTNTSGNYEQTIIISNSDYNAYTDIIRIYSAGGKGTYKAYKTTKSTGVSENNYSNKDFLLSDRITQDTGSDSTLVLSQNAVSKLLFNDTSTRQNVQIGNFSSANGTKSIAIGSQAKTNNNIQSISIGSEATSSYAYSTAIGSHADAGYYSVALGAGAKTTRSGEVNIGTGTSTSGFNSTSYRVLGGVYDGQELHDVATVAQGNTLATSAPTTSTVGVLGQLYTDTTNMHTYQCTAISGDTYTWTQRW